MTNYILDSWAWIEYLDGSSAGSRVHEIIIAEENNIFTSAVCVAEVVSKVIRRGKNHAQAIEVIKQLSKLVPVDEGLAASAGETHAKFREKISDFGLVDSMVIATAKKINAIIVTGDPHFKTVKGVILLNETK